MKKFILLVIMLIALFLTSCGSEGGETTTFVESTNALTTAPVTENVSFAIADTQAVREALSGFNDVMLDNTQLTQKSFSNNSSAEEKVKNLLLSEVISERFSSEDETLPVFVRFTITDLNTDGIPEVVLEDSGNLLKEVLFYSGGKVYGFDFTGRGMQSLKTDGTYTGTGGMEINYIYKLTFANNNIIEETLAYKDIYAEIPYKISGGEVSEQEVDAFFASQREKTDVSWCTFNTANIERYFK